jgi:hypothetical protein
MPLTVMPPVNSVSRFYAARLLLAQLGYFFLFWLTMFATSMDCAQVPLRREREKVQADRLRHALPAKPAPARPYLRTRDCQGIDRIY